MIVETLLTNPRGPLGVKGGNTTRNNVFIFCVDKYGQYSATTMGMEYNGWLRTPGYSPDCAVYATFTSGWYGNILNEHGAIVTKYRGVVPAIRVRMNQTDDTGATRTPSSSQLQNATDGTLTANGVVLREDPSPEHATLGKCPKGTWLNLYESWTITIFV